MKKVYVEHSSVFTLKGPLRYCHKWTCHKWTFIESNKALSASIIFPLCRYAFKWLFQIINHKIMFISSFMQPCVDMIWVRYAFKYIFRKCGPFINRLSYGGINWIVFFFNKMDPINNLLCSLFTSDCVDAISVIYVGRKSIYKKETDSYDSEGLLKMLKINRF